MDEKKKESVCFKLEGLKFCFLAFAFFLVLSLFFSLSLNFVSAESYNVSQGNLTKNYYSPEENIKGTINLTLVDYPVDTFFTDNFDNEISLMDLIYSDSSLTEGSSYTCSVKGCKDMFEASNPEEVKSFSLGSGEEKTIGIEFIGDLLDIKDVSFDVSSNAEESCFNQLEIDLLNDGTFEKGNTNSGSSFCSSSRGCFDSSLPEQGYGLGEDDFFCQNVSLPESPGYKLGASIKKISEGDRKLFMELRNSNGNSIEGANCELSKTGLSSDYSDVICQIDYYNNEQKNYYVCIYSDDGDGEYEVEGLDQTSDVKCGYNHNSNSPSDIVGSYNLFAKSKEFGEFGNLHVPNSLPNENSMSSEFQEYINERYNNCDSGCVVPIKFVSNSNQDIEVSNLTIDAEYSAGSIEENEFSDLEETSSTINMDGKTLSLNEGNFSVPSDFGNYTFELSLDNDVVFEDEVTVESVPEINYVTPTMTYANYPTDFQVKVNFTDSSLDSVTWDFGDNNVEESSSNQITYTYNNSGVYELEIMVLDKEGRASTELFNIIVGNPENISKEILEEKEDLLSNFSDSLTSISTYKSSKIKSLVNFNDLERELEGLQKKHSSSISEEEYKEVLEELIAFRVPKSLVKTSDADSIPFYPATSVINPDVVSEVSGGDVSNSQEYKDSIAAWNLGNLEPLVDYEEYSILYDNSEEYSYFISFASLDFQEGPSGGQLAYLFIEKLSDLDYSKNYLTSEVSGYDYIIMDDLSEFNNQLSFSFSESLSLDELPVFVSPELSQLNVQEDVNSEPASEGAGFWAWFFIFLLFVLIGLVFYTILQEWYKIHYEKYLFKDRTKLFNIINYIVISKKKGLKDGQISSELRKAGWSGEQVSYAMKKFYGKRTGMFEIIPVEKLRKYLRDKKNKKSDKNNKKPVFGKKHPNQGFPARK